MRQSNDANGFQALAISHSNEVRNFPDPSRSETLTLHLLTCIVVAAGFQSGQKSNLCKYCAASAATFSLNAKERIHHSHREGVQGPESQK